MKKIVPILYFSLAFCVLSAYAQSETVTILTYYPSPYGAYNALQAQRAAVGDVNNDTFITSADLPLSNGDLTVKNTLLVLGRIRGPLDCRSITSGWIVNSMAYATCNADEYLLTGGAICDYATHQVVQSSAPDALINNRWQAFCNTIPFGSASSSQAVAVCCKKQ